MKNFLISISVILVYSFLFSACDYSNSVTKNKEEEENDKKFTDTIDNIYNCEFPVKDQQLELIKVEDSLGNIIDLKEYVPDGGFPEKHTNLSLSIFEGSGIAASAGCNGFFGFYYFEDDCGFKTNMIEQTLSDCYGADWYMLQLTSGMKFILQNKDTYQFSSKVNDWTLYFKKHEVVEGDFLDYCDFSETNLIFTGYNDEDGNIAMELPDFQLSFSDSNSVTLTTECSEYELTYNSDARNTCSYKFRIKNGQEICNEDSKTLRILSYINVSDKDSRNETVEFITENTNFISFEIN